MSVYLLFLGAFLDALIGPNLFIPGEPFFIAAGYHAGDGQWFGVASVFFGGFIGDQISYFIGLKYGYKAQKSLIGYFPRIRRTIARCKLLMRQRGNYILAFARLLGPIAWMVPFVAGTLQIRWKRFTTYASVGLVLGIGQFVLWGILLSYGIDKIPLLRRMVTLVKGEQIYIYSAIGMLILFLGIWKFRKIISAKT